YYVPSDHSATCLSYFCPHRRPPRTTLSPYTTLFRSSQLHLLGQLVDLAVDPGSGVALRRQVGQEGVVGALPAPHHRGEHLEAGSLGQLEDPVHDLLGGLTGDLGSALWALGHADPREEEAQV